MKPLFPPLKDPRELPARVLCFAPHSDDEVLGCGGLLAFHAERGDEVRRRTKAHYGSTEHFARVLYTDYAVPFELITVLVMGAVAGVIVLARRPDSVTLEATKITAAGGGAA